MSARRGATFRPSGSVERHDGARKQKAPALIAARDGCLPRHPVLPFAAPRQAKTANTMPRLKQVVS
jgi:hypothetical protein